MQVAKGLLPSRRDEATEKQKTLYLSLSWLLEMANFGRRGWCEGWWERKEQLVNQSRARLTFLKYLRNIAAEFVTYEDKAWETADVASERVTKIQFVVFQAKCVPLQISVWKVISSFPPINYPSTIAN